MPRTIESDYQLGVASEDKNLPALRTLHPNLVKLSKMSPFDYKGGSTTFIELKTRLNAKDKYPTTMVGANKVKIAKENPDKEYFFAFSYTDGLYYIKYERDVFDTFETKRGGRWDRGAPELRDYVYIPVDRLTSIQSA